MHQEDNIYNNRVYRDKCHNNIRVLLHSGSLITKYKNKKELRIVHGARVNWETPPRLDRTPHFEAPPEPLDLHLRGG
jgi:hypothetical protein